MTELSCLAALRSLKLRTRYLYPAFNEGLTLMA